MLTDVTEDVLREVGLPHGLVDNKVCAISEVWSGLRSSGARRTGRAGPELTGNGTFFGLSNTAPGFESPKNLRLRLECGPQQGAEVLQAGHDDIRRQRVATE